MANEIEKLKSGDTDYTLIASNIKTSATGTAGQFLKLNTPEGESTLPVYEWATVTGGQYTGLFPIDVTGTVVSVAAASGDVGKYLKVVADSTVTSGARAEWATVSSGSSALSDLTDVSMQGSTPATGQVLTYRVVDNESKWTNQTLATSDITNLDTVLASKQGILSEGANISITNNTISATDTKYTNGTGLNLTDTTFSLAVPTANTIGGVKAGTNITISNDGTISSTGGGGGSYIFEEPLAEDGGYATLKYNVDTLELVGTSPYGVLSARVATDSNLGVVQVDGTTITATNGVISAVGGSGSYTAGNGIAIDNNAISVKLNSSVVHNILSVTSSGLYCDGGSTNSSAFQAGGSLNLVGYTNTLIGVTSGTELKVVSNSLNVGGSYNEISSVNIIGGGGEADNSELAPNGSVNLGGYTNKMLDSRYTIIAGGSNNYIRNNIGAIIAGGAHNTIDATYSYSVTPGQSAKEAILDSSDKYNTVIGSNYCTLTNTYSALVLGSESTTFNGSVRLSSSQINNCSDIGGYTVYDPNEGIGTDVGNTFTDASEQVMLLNSGANSIGFNNTYVTFLGSNCNDINQTHAGIFIGSNGNTTYYINSTLVIGSNNNIIEGGSSNNTIIGTSSSDKNTISNYTEHNTIISSQNNTIDGGYGLIIIGGANNTGWHTMYQSMFTYGEGILINSYNNECAGGSVYSGNYNKVYCSTGYQYYNRIYPVVVGGSFNNVNVAFWDRHYDSVDNQYYAKHKDEYYRIYNESVIVGSSYNNIDSLQPFTVVGGHSNNITDLKPAFHCSGSTVFYNGATNMWTYTDATAYKAKEPVPVQDFVLLASAYSGSINQSNVIANDVREGFTKKDDICGYSHSGFACKSYGGKRYRCEYSGKKSYVNEYEVDRDNGYEILDRPAHTVIARLQIIAVTAEDSERVLPPSTAKLPYVICVEAIVTIKNYNVVDVHYITNENGHVRISCISLIKHSGRVYEEHESYYPPSEYTPPYHIIDCNEPIGLHLASIQYCDNLKLERQQWRTITPDVLDIGVWYTLYDYMSDESDSSSSSSD